MRPEIPEVNKRMDMQIRAGFAAFGEVNTPYEKLIEKHDGALRSLRLPNLLLTDAGIVIDDEDDASADAAIAKLKTADMDVLIVCVAGWIPTHAVIRVTDEFRHLPILLWGLCGWREGGRIVTTAEQAGTTAIRPTFEAMGYRFRYVYNSIGKPAPMERIYDFLLAAHAARALRHTRVGTMGYRDMRLYGTQFEGNSLRAVIGVEVEPMEMLEMVQLAEKASEEEISEGLAYIREHWRFEKACPEEVLRTGVAYALALTKKVRQRGWDALTLIDVDGMKRLLGFPPSMIFMLLAHWCDIPTTPENDVMGNVTQLMLKLLTGETPAYMEFYEFFENSVLIGVPDYVPENVVDGEQRVLPAAFGKLATSVLNVSRVRTGRVTCARLIYLNGRYKLHLFTGEAKRPPSWAEYGWDEPVPQLPSLELMLDCPVEEFAQKVSSQHALIAYGDHAERVRALCGLLGVEVF